jgi:hypothetical protein
VGENDSFAPLRPSRVCFFPSSHPRLARLWKTSPRQRRAYLRRLYVRFCGKEAWGLRHEWNSCPSRTVPRTGVFRSLLGISNESGSNLRAGSFKKLRGGAHAPSSASRIRQSTYSEFQRFLPTVVRSRYASPCGWHGQQIRLCREGRSASTLCPIVRWWLVRLQGLRGYAVSLRPCRDQSS